MPSSLFSLASDASDRLKKREFLISTDYAFDADGTKKLEKGLRCVDLFACAPVSTSTFLSLTALPCFLHFSPKSVCYSTLIPLLPYSSRRMFDKTVCSVLFLSLSISLSFSLYHTCTHRHRQRTHRTTGFVPAVAFHQVFIRSW